MRSNTESFICTQLNGFKYCYIILIIHFNSHLFAHKKWLINSIRPIDRTFSQTINPCLGGPETNSNEVVLYIPQISKNWNFTVRKFNVNSSNIVGDGGVTLCRGAVSVFHSPNRHGLFGLEVYRLLFICFFFFFFFYSQSHQKQLIRTCIIFSII